ncbi:NUDIX domain-containing protein [Kitasatospora sp. NPDC059646]|uniref:NUDIX domain-containing protein n=1 Tax=Kitasatospora sp. NPDC059646 TaxID=3346893 RepID=UPI0036791ADE
MPESASPSGQGTGGCCSQPVSDGRDQHDGRPRRTSRRCAAPRPPGRPAPGGRPPAAPPGPSLPRTPRPGASPPAGLADGGEHLLATALSELAEETGIRPVAPLRPPVDFAFAAVPVPAGTQVR